MARPSRTTGPSVSVAVWALSRSATRRRAVPGANVKVEPAPVAMDADAAPADAMLAT